MTIPNTISHIRFPKLTGKVFVYTGISLIILLLLTSAIVGTFNLYTFETTKLRIQENPPSSQYAYKLTNKNSGFDSILFADRKTNTKGYSITDKGGVTLSMGYMGKGIGYSVQGVEENSNLKSKNSNPQLKAENSNNKQIQNTNEQNKNVLGIEQSQESKANSATLPITSTGKNGEAIITYKDIQPGVDLKYTTTKGQIKEEIIINNRNAVDKNPNSLPDRQAGQTTNPKQIPSTNDQNTNLSYSFTMNIEGLTYEKNQDGTVIPTFTSLRDKETTYTIPPAFMIDSKGAKSYGVTTTITEDETNPNTLIITLTPDTKWLLSADRQFPIIIDPTLIKGNEPVLTLNFDEGVGAVTYNNAFKPIVASGGTVSEYVGNGTNGTTGVRYKVHTFNSVGNSNFVVTYVPAYYPVVDALIVAGGGGGGNPTDRTGGGGGAGGLIYLTSQTISTQSYTITVGSGGAAVTNGNDSSAFGSTAIGGGYGATGPFGGAAGSGGSGGGSTHRSSVYGTGTTNQGYRGGNCGYDSGNGSTGSFSASGGGGAGAVGGCAATITGGAGGVGVQYYISGAGTYYAGGGGGGVENLGQGGATGVGGNGGGGNGGVNAGGSDGTPNTGGGGGGAGSTGTGGSGGSGVTIVRYPISSETDGTITASTWQDNKMCVSGKCLKYDGVNDYVTVPDHSRLDITDGTDLTLSVWVKLNSISSDQAIISKKTSTAAGDAGYILDYNTSSQIFELRVSDGTDQFIINSNTFTDTSKWIHITAVYDDSSATTSTIYINGVEQKASTTGTIASVNSLANSIALTVGTQGNGNADLNGFVDSVKVYNYARTALQARQDYIAKSSIMGVSVQFGPDTNRQLSDGLVGYWKMDEAGDVSRIDSSGNGNTLPESTGDTIAQATGKFGSAGDFERGDTEYLELPDVSQNGLDLETNKFTFSAWLNVESTDVSQAGILGKSDATQLSYVWSTDTVRSFGIYLDDDGYAGGDIEILSGANVITLSTWEHFTVTYDGSYIRLYKNGLEQTTGDFPYATTTTLHQGTSDFYLGIWDSQGGYYDGLMDEVRVYNRALSPSEISALFSFAPGPVVHFDLNENSGTSTVYDKSGNGYVGTMNGSMTATDWVPGKFGSALNFDANDDNIDADSAAAKIVETSGTIETWVKPRITQSHTILSTGASGGGSDGIYFDTNTNVFRITYRNAGWSAEGIVQSYATFTPGQWYHLAATWSTNSLKLYVNGALDNSGTLTSAIANQDLFTIGAYSSEYVYGDDVFDGDIDEVKIYDYVRTQGQIIEDMNGGHPVGGSPVGSQAGYWKFDEGYGDTANDWSPQNIDGNLSGSTSCPSATVCPAWTSSGKFGKGIYFGGLQTADGDSHVRLTNNIYDTQTQGAISLWIKPDDSGDAGQSIIGAAEDDNNGWTDVLSVEYIPADNLVGLYVIDNGSLVTGLYAEIDPTVWTHLVVSADEASNTTDIFINGKKAGSEAEAYWFSDISENTTAYTLGCVDIDGSDTNDCSDANLYQGFLDEVKIYSAPLTEPQIKTEYAQGKSNVMGAVSTASDGKTPSYGADRSFCIPGDTTTCNPPVAYWKFDEGTETSVVYDSSGNGYSGSMNGSMTEGDWVPGKNGKGLDFDGSDDRIEITHNSNLNGSTNMVISAWIKLRDYNSSWASMIAEKKANSAAGWQFFVRGTIDGTNQKKLTFNMDDGSNDNYVFADTELQLNTWYHVAIDYNDTANTLTFYVNGKPDGIRTISASPSSNTSAMSIGGFSLLEPNGYLYDFNGVIDDIKIYNYSRSSAQNAWEYNRGAPIAHYKFDECTGTTIKDWAKNANGTGMGNTGTLSIGGGGTNDGAGTCGGDSSEAWYNGVDGKYGASVFFDGSDDGMWSATSTPLTITGDVTLSAWVYHTTDGSRQTIVDYAAAGDTQDANALYKIMIDSDNTLRGFWEYGSGTDYGFNSTVALSTGLNSWVHISMTRDSSANIVKFYENGRQLGADISYSNDADGGTVSYFSVGYDYAAGNQYFYGKIDDVKIYNYVLTPAQIRDAMNGGAVSFR